MTHTTLTNGTQPHRPNKREPSSHEKHKRPPSDDINYRRRRNLAKLVVHRHGRLARANQCIPYAEAAAWHCPSGSERRFLMVQWCRWTCAPPSVERQINAILDANPPRRIRADTLARHLHVSDAERTELRIWSIGSYDVPKAKRIKRRKEKRRLADQARRRDNGSKPREQSHSRTKPWEAFGIKRRAWELRGKPMPTTQIRGQYASLPSGREFASSSTTPPAARARCTRNGHGKGNGEHGARQRRRLPTKQGTSAQPLATATPRLSQVVHLEAVGLG